MSMTLQGAPGSRQVKKRLSCLLGLAHMAFLAIWTISAVVVLPSHGHATMPGEFLRENDTGNTVKLFDIEDRIMPDYLPLCGAIQIRYSFEVLMHYQPEFGQHVDVFYLCQAMKKVRSDIEIDQLHNWYFRNQASFAEKNPKLSDPDKYAYAAQRLKFFDTVIEPFMRVNNDLLEKYKASKKANIFENYADLKARQITLLKNAIAYCQANSFPAGSISEMKLLLSNMNTFFSDRAGKKSLQTHKSMKF
ncbi:hypothetical protein QA648_36665 (plasmid) [Rhizobium sp. CB3171]|uniref:hypothetical protein n=1 Tax=Rhizobium sp. CB3171 TaxID=3039157 RepID=UPI0024B27319|nr:hypothetical protein [Rhizobium sp. CB3171]WFU07460.1 hypothetical protein QA648_36665 [Rhizobium sp. CB3171]